MTPHVPLDTHDHSPATLEEAVRRLERARAEARRRERTVPASAERR